MLLGCGAVALLSEKAKEGSDESRLTCIKALYGISKCESLTNDEAREGGIINATESVLKARPLLGAEILLHAVRCIVNLSGNAALRPFMSSVCGALSGVLKELGSDAQREIKIKAAQFVVNVSKDSGGVAAAEVSTCTANFPPLPLGPLLLLEVISCFCIDTSALIFLGEIEATLARWRVDLMR